MSTAEVHARLDDFARRLQGMERELGELRMATQRAPAPISVPPPAPVARPAARRPLATPKPLKRRRQLPQIDADMLFGARGLAWSGGLVTILGVLFFFVLAVDRGWIGPVARVSLGATASALLFGGGLWLHRRYGDTYAASSAVAAGIAGGFATLLFATARYDLLPDLAALAVAGALAAIATATALAWGAQTIAGLGLVGAMLVPIAAAIDEPHHLTVVGTWFAVLTLAATAVVALHRRWLPVLGVAAAALVPQVLVLARQDDGAVSVAAAAWLLMIAIAVVAQRTNRGRLDRLPAGFVTAGTAMAGLAAAQLFDGRSEGLALLAIAGVELLAAAVLYRALPELAALLGVAGLTAGAVAASDLLSGATLATAWAAEAAVLAWLSPRLRDARLTLASIVFLTAAAVRALAVDAPLRHLLTEVPHPAAGALALVAVAAAAVVTAIYARPWRGPAPRYAGLLAFLEEPAAFALSVWRERRIVALWSAGTLLLYAAALGLVDLAGFGWGHVAVRGLVAVTAVALVACAGPGWRRHLGWAGHLVVLAGVAFIPRVDVLSSDQLGLGAAIMGAGALVLVLIDELRRYEEPVARFVAPVFALGSIVLAVIGTWLLVEPRTARDLALLGVAALYAAFGALVGWRGRRGTSTALWAPAIVVALYAAAALLDGTALVIVIAAGSAAAVTIAEVVGERRLQLAAGAPAGRRPRSRPRRRCAPARVLQRERLACRGRDRDRVPRCSGGRLRRHPLRPARRRAAGAAVGRARLGARPQAGAVAPPRRRHGGTARAVRPVTGHPGRVRVDRPRERRDQLPAWPHRGQRGMGPARPAAAGRRPRTAPPLAAHGRLCAPRHQPGEALPLRPERAQLGHEGAVVPRRRRRCCCSAVSSTSGSPGTTTAGRYPPTEEACVSRASTLSSTLFFNAWETGQLAFASSANSRKPFSSRPGTLPSTASTDLVIPVPGTKVTVAEVFSCSGGVPALARMFEKAIEKQDACAAAISSSGLVRPFGSSVREAHVTSRGPNAPLPTRSIVPLPLKRSPFQVTSARRSAAMRFLPSD